MTRLIRQGYHQHPAMDVAIAHALLETVAAGGSEDVFRIHVPSHVVAFGRTDLTRPGYPAAIRAAGAHGYAAVERLAGGRAAVFHSRTLAFSWAMPTPEPRNGVEERFRVLAELMREAFRQVGVDARIGPVPGEYCPGAWSVSLAGKRKVMGVGQRLTRGAAHLGGVIVVDGGDTVAEVLIPVYRALEHDWDPRTAGALTDQAPDLSIETVMEAVVSALARRTEVEPASVPESVLERAGELLPDHLPRVA